LEQLETRPAQYAVVARLTPDFKRLLPGLRYELVNQQWEMAECEHRSHGWPPARRFVVGRRFIPGDEEEQSTLFSLGRYLFRAWVTNMDLTPAGIWHFYDGRAAMEPRICERREDFALRKIPTASFAANALYLEIIRLAYNLVTIFQQNCLPESWQTLTLQKLRYKLFLIPGELTRPDNRPILRLRQSPVLREMTSDILKKVHRLKPLTP
jgi:Transposase DDE domain group 1